MKDVAIVILNYNTRDHLAQYLPSVVAHSDGARIIIADNGSPDDSIEFVRTHYPAIEIIDLGQNWGFAEGYNQALKHIDAEWSVLLNSDVEVTAGWLQPVLEAMQANPKIAIAQPKIKAWSRKNTFEHAGAAGGWLDYLGYPFCRGRLFTYSEEDHGQYDEAQSCFWAAGAAFFIKTELYKRFEGFDADYFAHNEEIDLCWRVKRAGYEVWCIPQSVVYHLGGGTLGYESRGKVLLNFRNSLYSLIKNEPFFKLLWLIPTRLILDGVAALMYLSQKKYFAISAILEAHGDFYRHFGSLITKRRKVRRIVEANRIAPNTNLDGRYSGSIVFKHYLMRVKTFAKL